MRTTPQAASSERRSGAPLPHEDRQRARETRRVEAAEQASDHRPAQQDRVPARPERNAPVRRRNAITPRRARRTTKPSRRAEERARGYQCLREPRQRLPALLIDRYDLRHDVDEQYADHREGDHRDDHRVDERQHHLLPQRFARFEIVGEACEHFGEASGFRAGADETAIQRRECARITRERGRQRFARGDVRAQICGELRRPRIVGLLRHRPERLVERHAGLVSVASCRVVMASVGAGNRTPAKPSLRNPAAATAVGVRPPERS
jgi:hypothetical protein